jgi:hypothetical protein
VALKITRDPQSPTAAEWLVAALALLLAAGLVVVMVLFAQRANRDASLVNWFGLVTALAGAATFELMKYALTVRGRHLNELAMRINVTPTRVEELQSLTSDVERARRMYAAVSAAIELRARELLLKHQGEELRSQAAKLQSALTDLAEQEHRLALDAEANASKSLVREVQEMVDTSERRNEPLKPTMRSLGSLEFVMPGTSSLATQFVSYLDRQLARRRARQMRSKATSVTENRDHDRQSN